jgi:hypothetical protein
MDGSAAALPDEAVDRDPCSRSSASAGSPARRVVSALHLRGHEGVRRVHEAAKRGNQHRQPQAPPMGVAVFAADSQHPFLARFPSTSLASVVELDRGGHFPAMETPDSCGRAAPASFISRPTFAP